MKQMRSRFRLMTFLLVCAFFVTLAMCAGSILKTADVSLPSGSELVSVVVSILPVSSETPEPAQTEEFTPAPSETPLSESPGPGTDNPPIEEYNVEGL